MEFRCLHFPLEIGHRLGQVLRFRQGPGLIQDSSGCSHPHRLNVGRQGILESVRRLRGDTLKLDNGLLKDQQPGFTVCFLEARLPQPGSQGPFVYTGGGRRRGDRVVSQQGCKGLLLLP
jgi:hypothetical protein